MRLVKVQLFGKQNRGVLVDPDATQGAVFGKNLIWPSGALVTVADLVRNVTGGVVGVGGSVAVTVWELIQNIPAYIQSLASLATVGFVVRKSDGTAVTRSIVGTDGRISTLDGDGDAGNAVINLGAFPTVQNGVYNGEVGTIPELHQMIVMDEFVFDDGILNIDGELIVL